MKNLFIDCGGNLGHIKDIKYASQYVMNIYEYIYIMTNTISSANRAIITRKINNRINIIFNHIFYIFYSFRNFTKFFIH
jgi:hypothetical protein